MFTGSSELSSDTLSETQPFRQLQTMNQIGYYSTLFRNCRCDIIILLITFCLFSIQQVHSQDKPLLQFSKTGINYIVYGQVQDFITRQPLVDVRSQILTRDSVLLFEWTTNYQSGMYDVKLPFILLVPEEGDYILRFSKDGYEESVISYKVNKLRKRESAMIHEPVLLRRRAKDKTLKEVTVKATKVKFYVRGDTLVYNADAFQLEEGSMLDALIRQLPGTELKDDGRILVNGKPVESLLLNGEDFFKKDRTIMLENLPTYMVNKVQVYEKDGQMGQLLGQRIGDQNLVMDVRLKKQYEIGWMGNVEAAGGTHERYLARLFALRFTAHSRLSAFANVNNLNDRQRPGVSSEWMPVISGGLGTTHNGGVDYLINDRRHRFKLEGDAIVNHTDMRNEERTSSLSYLPGGDVYGRNRYTSYAHSLSVNTNHTWTFNRKWVNFILRPTLSFSKNRGDKASLAAMAEHELFSNETLDILFAPDVSQEKLYGVINRTKSEQKYDGHDLSTGMQMQASIKLPHTMDKLMVEARAYYTDSKQYSYTHRFYDYPKEASSLDLRNEYGRNGWESYNAVAKLTYISWVIGHNWTLMPSYEYAMDRTTQRNNLYRLDYLIPDAAEWPALGGLPSVSDWMEQTFDPNHSVSASVHNNYHVVAVKMHKEEFRNNRWRFDFNFPLSIDRKQLDYNRPALVDTAFVKHFLFFRPSLTAHNSWFRQADDGRLLCTHELDLSYEMGMEPPSMTYFVDVRTDDNPLQVFTGNKDLDVMHRHKWSAGYKWNNAAKHRLFSASADYQLTQNAVAMGYSYNRETGVYTYRPENVNGNSSVSGRLNFSTPIDKRERLMLDLNTNVSHLHSVDLSGEDADEAFRKSYVNTTYLTQGIRLNYSIGKIRIGGKSSATYTHQTSRREDFFPTDAVDFNYGLTFVADIPMGWQLSTDATMYSRRGYSDSEMNSDNLVWNIRVAKRFMKGRLNLMLDGFDVLNNLSNINRRINAQGHAETWYMSIPRYAMLHAVYRFNKSPKKRQ